MSGCLFPTVSVGAVVWVVPIIGTTLCQGPPDHIIPIYFNIIGSPLVEEAKYAQRPTAIRLTAPGNLIPS